MDLLGLRPPRHNTTKQGLTMKNVSHRVPYRAMFPFYALCASIFLCAIPVQSATYYVATTGNDSNPGTLSRPFQSFAKGVSVLQPGDTLYIRGGIYTQILDTGTKTGSPGNYITIAAYQGEPVILQPPSSPKCKYAIVPRQMHYFILDGLVWDGINGCEEPYGFRIVDGTHHLTVQNMEIKNGKYNGIYIGNADNITIRNNKIHDQVSPTGLSGQRYYGIYFHHGTNSVIEGNEIYGNPGGGIHAYPGPISNLVIRSNKLHHNNHLSSSPVEGILVFQGSISTPIRGVQIYNNLIYLNGVEQPDPGRSGGIRVSSGVSSTKIWHNTIYGNKGWGINIQMGSSGPPINTDVQNNIVFGNTLGQIIDVGIGSSLTHNLTTDPKFVKADAFDFRLQLHSVGIDGGVDLTEVRTDFRNSPRPKGATHDIGAYEDDGSDIKSLSAPKNLVAR